MQPASPAEHMHFLQLEGLSPGEGEVLFQKWPTLDPDTLPLRARASFERERRNYFEFPSLNISLLNYSIIIDCSILA